jgi:hypothetical protein
MDMEGTGYGKHLADEVKAGRVPVAQIDAAVEPLLHGRG